MQIVGLLQPAVVLAFDGAALRLGYDAYHEPIRQRATGLFGSAVAEALSALAGRQLRCEFVPAALPAPAGARPPAPPKPLNNLSTDEKSRIAKDPAVVAVTQIFGCQSMEFRQEQPARAAETDEEPPK